MERVRVLKARQEKNKSKIKIFNIFTSNFILNKYYINKIFHKYNISNIHLIYLILYIIYIFIYL